MPAAIPTAIAALGTKAVAAAAFKAAVWAAVKKVAVSALINIALAKATQMLIGKPKMPRPAQDVEYAGTVEARRIIYGEMLCGGNEVVKAVALALTHAVRAPGFVELTAAAHVSNGVDKAAIDQRQHVRVERRVGRHPVGAVAVEQQRRAAVSLEAPGMQQEDRDPGAIAGNRVDALGHIPRDPVTGGNGLRAP